MSTGGTDGSISTDSEQQAAQNAAALNLKKTSKNPYEIEIQFVQKIKEQFGKVGTEPDLKKIVARGIDPLSIGQQGKASAHNSPARKDKKQLTVRERLRHQSEAIAEAYRTKPNLAAQDNEEKKRHKLPPKIPFGKNMSDPQRPYPLCMTYYEPHNCVIFGLITKEVQIHQMSTTGIKQKFIHLQSLRVDQMITGISVDEYKMSDGLLMICVAT